MNPGARTAALNKFRNNAAAMMRQPMTTKVLVLYDVTVKSNDVPLIPLIINYGMCTRSLLYRPWC